MPPSRRSTAIASASALGDRLAGSHEVPAGEASKTIAHATRLWSALRLDRSGTVVAVGGGTALDLAGFTASAYLRGVAWAPVPTTLVAQVDAAIGGKTAVDLPEGKNLVGTLPLAGARDRRSRAARDAARGRARERARRGREDGPPRRGAGLGAADRGAGAALRGVQGGGVPARSRTIAARERS